MYPRFGGPEGLKCDRKFIYSRWVFRLFDLSPSDENLALVDSDRPEVFVIQTRMAASHAVPLQ